MAIRNDGEAPDQEAPDQEAQDLPFPKSKADVTERPTDTDACSYNGTTYLTGDVFCASDGCNACRCNPEGTVGVRCTQEDCSADDVVIAGVCQLGDKQLPECPRDEHDVVTVKQGDACPSGFTGCNITAAMCHNNKTCACVDNKIDCWFSPPRDGKSCSIIEPGAKEEWCSDWIETESWVVWTDCSCSGDKWSCKDRNCPLNPPKDGDACEVENTWCSFFLAEAQCPNTDDLFAYCECKSNAWTCRKDEESCHP